ncbi:MAG: phenylalanine--tRNA ligase subunit alpha [Candidatus Micrarchaeia archaeon]
MNEKSLIVLKALTHEYADAREIAAAVRLAPETVMSALETLKEEGYAEVARAEEARAELTPEGLNCVKRGLPERRLWQAVGESAGIKEAAEAAGLNAQETSVALQWAKKKKWLEIKAGRLERLDAPVSKIEEFLLNPSAALPAHEVFAELFARKLAIQRVEKRFSARATSKATQATGEAKATRLTPEDLKSGDWRKKKYAEYDLATLNDSADYGKKHAYKEFLNRIRGKLAAMGFQEARGPLVELEFWNMDALFMAQDHPAREIHDVFQVDDPCRGEILDSATLSLVKKAHERGLAGSKGWGYKWDPEIAARLVMRSQTTAVSARELAKGVKPPARIFSIGRVFRPDEIDWKHFIEFNQCEGIVVEEGLSFRELLGYLKDFAAEVFGAREIKFAPSYFPFTEPSVEMHANIPGKGWAEVGGAGMFRPEMLAALGVKTPVLAWGLGIDRLAMVELEAKDIRELMSRDLDYLRGR